MGRTIESAVLSALVLGLLWGAAAARADAPITAVAPAGEAAWLDVTLAGLPGEAKESRLLLMTLGGKVERGVVPPLGMGVVDVSGLNVHGGKIAGKLVIGHERVRQNASIPPLARRMPLAVELSIGADGKVSGTYQGQWPAGRDGKPADTKGSVSGTALDEAALRKTYAFREGAEWPSYVGPNQNFSSGPSTRPIVEDLNNARLVWASEYIGPCEAGSRRYGACVGVRPAAGGASPVVADGKVFQFRYQASGSVYDPHVDQQFAGARAEENKAKMEAIGWTMAEMKNRWAISADEELVCIDAATGKTLWRVTWADEGINLLDHKCGLTNHTGVYSHGRMYVVGALGTVRCVDGASGKVLWSADVPGISEAMKDIKAKALKSRAFSAPGRAFAHGLNVSGSTILAPDSTGPCGLVGLDAATGKVLWRSAPRIMASGATPLAWRHGQKDYAIAADSDGRITLIDAASGTVMWQYTEAGTNGWTPLLVGDLLIGHKLKKEERIKLKDSVDEPGAVLASPGDNYGQVACWKLSPEKIEQVWAAPTEWGAPVDSPVGSATDGLVCFRGRYSYRIVQPETGKELAKSFLSSPARFDEGHMLALPGMFVVHPDTQHGYDKLYPFPARPGAKIGPVWMPPHPYATTYAVAMSHAWVDGRLFIRGVDAIYCYDLRQPAGK